MTNQHRATPEQQARDMLNRMGVPNAQSYSSGDLAELANLIAATSKPPGEWRATPEEWAEQKMWASEPDVDINSLCLLELRARVEALEAAQRCRFVEIDTSQWTDKERQRVMQSAKEPGRFQPLRVETVYADPSVPVEGMVREVSMTLDEAAAIVAAQRSEQAPADSLVERVMDALESNYVVGNIEGSWDAQARAAIREVVAWLHDNDAAHNMGGDAAEVADLLGREASR